MGKLLHYMMVLTLGASIAFAVAHHTSIIINEGLNTATATLQGVN